MQPQPTGTARGILFVLRPGPFRMAPRALPMSETALYHLHISESEAEIAGPEE